MHASPLLVLHEEEGYWHLQGIGDAFQHVDTEIPASALDVAYVGAMQPGNLAHLSLAEREFFAAFANAFAYSGEQRLRCCCPCHNRVRPAMTISSWSIVVDNDTAKEDGRPLSRA